MALGLNNVADCLDSLGRSEDALPKHQAALEMRERIYKGDHPYVAASLNNMAGCLVSLGRLDEAGEYYLKGNAMDARLKRRAHPEVWRSAVTAHSLVENSTAAGVGVKPEDVIVSYDGVRVFAPSYLIVCIKQRETENKKTFTLEILRDGKLMQFEVPPGKLGIILTNKDLTQAEAGEALLKYGNDQ